MQDETRMIMQAIMKPLGISDTTVNCRELFSFSSDRTESDYIKIIAIYNVSGLL